MRKILFKLTGVLLGTLLVVCLVGCGNSTAYYVDSTEKENTEISQSQNTAEETSQTQSIYVYVCGQIVHPGVYTLPEGSRVCDVFELAGGFTSEAAIDYWNQARLLVDGEMIYVPTAEEVKDRQLKGDGTGSLSVDTENDNKVNINTASKEELMTIPGIGESKALAILLYRQENGPFSSIEEIKNVAGIKDGVYSKMKDYIKIN